MNQDTLPVLIALVFLTALGGLTLAPLSVSAAPGHDGVHTHDQPSQSSDTTATESDDDTESTDGSSTLASDTVTTTGHGASTTHPSEGLLKPVLPGLSGAPNFHPMLVHFPIVFLVTATLFVLLSWISYPEHFLMLGRWMFWLGLISLPVVLASGFWAVGGWGGGHVSGHRNLMLLTTLLAYLVFAAGRFVSSRKRLYRIVLTVGLVIVTMVMTLGADRGAYLVFVEGHGVQSAQHRHSH